MSTKRYTVTLYISPPGALMEYKDSKGQIVRDTSSVGHVFYAISDDGGKVQSGYGFSPKISSPIYPGHVVADEQKIYQEFSYKRTIEINKEQYEKLKTFGEASLDKENHAKKISNLTNGKFSTSIYNAGSNSCVDYVFHALRYSGVYNHKVKIPEYRGNGSILGMGKSTLVEDDGRVNVLNNAKIFNQIPIVPEYQKSTLNRIEDKTKDARQKAPWYLKVENEKTPNENIDQTIFTLVEPGFLNKTNNLIARLQSGDKQALTDFVSNPEVQEAYKQSVVQAEFLDRQDLNSGQILPNLFDRLALNDMPKSFKNLCRECREHLENYYQEKGIRYNEVSLDNTVMALAGNGYKERMQGVTMLSFQDGNINIVDDSVSGFRMASVNARTAALTDKQDSFEQVRQAEQIFEQQERQREMERLAERHSRGITMS
ncbi:hypothetical protein [Neisseria sp.]|uniref:hypothetical protein n=1 Tax=Neisseria sp. TaxID=192066 RepID=UPI0035A071B9